MLHSAVSQFICGLRKVPGISLMLLLSWIPCLAGGCAAPAVIEDDSPDNFCPDVYVRVSSIALSLSVDAEGNPVEPGNLFPSGSEQIICTFWLTDDLCCTTVTVAWFMEGEIISQWARDGFEIRIPTSVVLSNLPSGFVKGNYEVKVYLNTEEKISCEFSIY